MTAGPSPEKRLNDLLAAAGATLATAESCSGGGVAARVTSIAGSSVYFLGGVVAYANEAKADILGVPRDVLATRGAVSAETAAAMAEGARRLFGATLAVSTTGIAGPGGGTRRKPVGLVYLALAGPNGTHVERHRFAGDRAAVTNAAIERALALLVDGVEEILRIRS
ncbi:MAG TPA: CinA family protein [Thermomicrobiales bacterium]|nr:CinA family protein [Thermomicrobiales bacterium]